jgi:hypothetical protein
MVKYVWSQKTALKCAGNVICLGGESAIRGLKKQVPIKDNPKEGKE